MSGNHPLDHEEVLVVVVITHLPTGAVGGASQRCPADTDPSVLVGAALATEKAMDDVLAKVEQGGAG